MGGLRPPWGNLWSGVGQLSGRGRCCSAAVLPRRRAGKDGALNNAPLCLETANRVTLCESFLQPRAAFAPPQGSAPPLRDSGNLLKFTFFMGFLIYLIAHCPAFAADSGAGSPGRRFPSARIPVTALPALRAAVAWSGSGLPSLCGSISQDSTHTVAA